MNITVCFFRLAYIDPGTGGMILQLAMATLVGAGLYFRRGIQGVVRLLFRKKKNSQHEPDHKS